MSSRPVHVSCTASGLSECRLLHGCQFRRLPRDIPHLDSQDMESSAQTGPGTPTLLDKEHVQHKEGLPAAPATSVAKRTQRVQWMHLVITVLTRGPRFLSCTERFISVNLPLSLPKCIDCRDKTVLSTARCRTGPLLIGIVSYGWIITFDKTRLC